MSLKLAVVLGLTLLVVIGFAFHWWILDIRRIWDWLVYAEPADLPGQDGSSAISGGHDTAPVLILAGEHHPDPDTWDRLDPDQAADILIAEWHDEPPADWPAAPDVWDQWWAGMDGLERECLKVTRWRQREQQLWAELKAETRELCGVAA